MEEAKAQNWAVEPQKKKRILYPEGRFEKNKINQTSRDVAGETTELTEGIIYNAEAIVRKFVFTVHSVKTTKLKAVR
jgi:hypothetical protein